jgi:elongation factor G
MTRQPVDKIRDVALCGHGSSGKTTLADHILHQTGAVNRLGSVDEQTSLVDYDEIERAHKYTIEAKLLHFNHAGIRFNLLDTPGYPDFIGQTLCALSAVDTAVIVINAHSGIEVNTRRVFHEAGKLGLGRIILINKMDSENLDFPALVESIRATFGTACVLFNVPLGSGTAFKGVASALNVPASSPGALIDPAGLHESLIEAIVEVDEKATERYFEGEEPAGEELARLVVASVAAGSLIPIVCASGKNDLGVKEFLDTLALCALPPDKIRRTARNEAGEEVEIKPDPNGPLVAQVFKTRIDPFVQKLSYIRVYSGTLKKDSTVNVSGARKGLKISQLLEVQAGETHPIEEAGPGDLVAIAKAEELHTGTTLGDLTLPKPQFPTPMVGLAVSPKSRNDEAKLSGALHKVVEEDPTFRLDRDTQTKELVMTGMSELHLHVIQERLKRRDKVDVETKEPKIPYRETIQATAEGSYRHKKQTGGRGQFGEVHIRMFPFPADVKPEEYISKEKFPSMRAYHYDPEHHFLWIDSIVGGTIPNNFLPAVEKGFKERLERGVIAGYRIQNVAVEVYFGKHHPVDSSEAAFKTAGSMAFRNVFQQARPALLEPIVRLHVTVPSDKVGDVNSDMSGRRGRVQGLESAGGDFQTVTAEVPLSEVTTYARTLSSMTGGQGSYTMEFSHYDVVPGNIQKEIVEKAQLKEEEEE